MTKKKIFFFGTPKIAIHSLKKISELSDYKIIGVGVFPDSKVGRKQILTPCAIKIAAQQLGLKVFEIPNKDELIKLYQTQDFDLGIVIAFGMIFPSEILETKKFINVHFSLLPAFRGASPVQSAILAGEKTSGITWQIMASELDSGDILLQKSFNIKGLKTSEIWNNFSEKTAEIFPAFLEKYFSKTLSPTPQKIACATFCTKFTKTDAEIFPKKDTAQSIYQKFLAFTPWPGIFMQTIKGALKLTDVSLQKEENLFPLPCDNNSILYVRKAQLAGKKELSISELLKGNPTLFTK